MKPHIATPDSCIAPLPGSSPEGDASFPAQILGPFVTLSCDALIHEKSPHGILITDEKGAILWVNEGFVRQSGFRLSEVSGKCLETVLSASENETTEAKEILRAITEGRSCEKTLLIHTKAGCPALLDWKLFPVFDSGGKIRNFVAIQKNATSRDHHEGKVPPLEGNRWQFAQEAPGDGLWDYNLSTNRLYLSRQCKAMLGYTEEEIGETLADWEGLVHPDDLKQTNEDFFRHIKSESPFYRSEHRLLCKDGSYKWILDRGKILEWSAEGEPLRAVGTHTDITERREMEQRLRESEERLRAVLDTATGVSLIATDPKGVITFFSKGAAALLGYSSEELLGHSTPLVFHDSEEISRREEELSDPPSRIVEGFQVFTIIPEQNGFERREWTYICKDGTRKSVELTVTVSRDPLGRILGYLGTAVDITDRKQMEISLRANEQKFRGMFELSPVGMALNDFETGRFLDANQALLDSMGYTSGEFFNLSYWEITPSEYEPREKEQLQSLKENRRYGPYEKEYIRKNGERYPVLLHGMLLDSSEGNPVICSIIQDISGSKRIERELREAAESQRVAYALLEAAGRIAHVGHWELPVDSNLFSWSDVTYEIYDVPPGTPVTREDSLDFCAPNDRQKIARLLKCAIETGEPFEFETELHTPKGRKRWVHSRGKAVRDERGRIIALRGVVQDIDERRRAADLLERRNRQLEIATQKAEAHARSKTEFLANMSHEIRTPLNAIIGLSELLSDISLQPREKELLETIRKSGDILVGLINDILDFSKIESGLLDLERIPIHLRECVESALDLVSQQATRKKLDLLYWIDPSVPPTILGDLSRLRQVLVNLLTNAIKFTETGEIFIRLTLKNDNQGTAWLHVAVKDSGIGIPRDRLDRLFVAFSQGDPSTTRRYGGTGLGLAISYRLVEMMKGCIWVESQAGHGSVFQFEIPVEAVEAPIPTNLGKAGARALEGLRLLVADGNATNRWILKKYTESWGMVPFVADGLQALEHIRGGEKFDLAILDVGMPDVDGYELAAEIRKKYSMHDVPILILTSIGDKGRNLQELGISGTLTKPVKATPLFNALCNMLGNRRESLKIPICSTAPDQEFAATCPLRILVAEDNPVNQRVTILLLQRLGYRSTLVSNGLEVLSALEKEDFDVILLDIQMPEMDGLEATREICLRYPANKRPWIIALTAHALSGDREDCLAAGMDDYLSKPIRSEGLRNALQTAFDKKTSASAR